MRNTRASWLLPAIIACLVSAGCATAGSPDGASDNARVRPPEMLSRGNGPQLQIPPSSSSRSPIRLSIEVEVDESGRADIETLKLTGLGAVNNRLAIEQWLAGARFRPARRDGVAVRGVYKTSLEVRVTTTVIRRG